MSYGVRSNQLDDEEGYEKVIGQVSNRSENRIHDLTWTVARGLASKALVELGIISPKDIPWVRTSLAGKP